MSDTTKSVDDELFGRYALIEMKRHGAPNEYYRHKVIGRFRSNAWVDVPIQSPATPTIHDHSEDVVNVICCGVIEETVYRVRLSDVRLDPLPQLFTKQLQEARKEGRKEGRKQMGEKIKRHSERADFFNPEAKVVLADTFAWLSGLDEDTKGGTDDTSS